MGTFAKQIGWLLFRFMGLVLLLSFAGLWGLRQGNFYKPSFLENGVEDTALDYIILGASTGLTTLNTTVIDSVLGTNGLNLAMDDTAMSSQYLMLQHFVASGKTAKVCVLAPSFTDYNAKNSMLSGNDYRFLPYVNRDYVKAHYSSFDSFEARVLKSSDWFPLAGVGYFNAEIIYPAFLSMLRPTYRNRFDSKGNYSYPVYAYPSKAIVGKTPIAVSFGNAYLKKIQALCAAQGMQLVCYMAPLKEHYAVVGPTSYEIVDHSNLILDARYFYDATHVNALGRQLASLQFAKDLRELGVEKK